jgi:hypothetical protein
VDDSLIDNMNRVHSSDTCLKVFVGRSCWDQYTAALQISGEDKSFSVKYVFEGTVVASGMGASRDFYTKAWLEFKSRYLIEKGMYTDYNYEALAHLSPYDLKLIGTAIHNMCKHVHMYLPFSLPIDLIIHMTHVQSLRPSTYEYFASIENNHVYTTIMKHKDDFDSLNTGYATYTDALKNVCHCSPASARVSEQIAKGIVRENGVNAATIDVMYCDRIEFDIEAFVAEIDLDSAFGSQMKQFLLSLNADQVKNLLLNWTCYSHTTSASKLKVIFRDTGVADIRISTCNETLSIHQRVMEQDNYADILKGYLVDRVDCDLVG